MLLRHSPAPVNINTATDGGHQLGEQNERSWQAQESAHCSEGRSCCDFFREKARRSGDDDPEDCAVTMSDESSPMVLACVVDIGPDAVSCRVTATIQVLGTGKS